MEYRKNCLVCGKEFIKPQNESKKNWENRHKYCSKECKDKSKIGLPAWNSGIKTGIVPKTAFKKGQHASPATEFKKGMITGRKGKPLSTERYSQLKEAGFFEPKFGEKSPRWEGGKTKLSLSIRGLKVYLDWRKAVFERDGYACKKCGDIGYIHAHHIKPFALILKQNNIKSAQEAIACKELWDVNNGETLCIPCHEQTDSYGVNLG